MSSKKSKRRKGDKESAKTPKPEKRSRRAQKKPRRVRVRRPRPGSFSIAFQISSEQLIMQAVTGLLTDASYVGLVLLSVLYNAEMTASGQFSWFGKARLSFGGAAQWRDYLLSAVVTVSTSGGEIVTTPVGNTIWFLFVSLTAILTIQFIVLIVSCVTIPGRTYERLKPLYNMTEAAQELKNIDITSTDSLDSADFEIHTGKEELAGLEDAVNDLLRRTRSSYKSQIRFVSDASHELRTPIAVIQGYANMLDRWGREDKEILDESIESIKSEAENMNRLVENLLFLARGDSGRAVIRFESIDIGSLICDIYDEFVMIDKTHEFHLDMRDDVKAVADQSLIKQCMRILVDNAIKYSPENTDIIIRLQKRDERYYSIDVQDCGIGMNQEEVGKIFERFYRSDPARNRRSGGYGLGLSIAKWIADKHGGFFEVLSYENIGTRISLVLPFEGRNE